MFMIYNVQSVDGEARLSFTGEQYQLAGHGLLHRLWAKMGSPRNSGWHVGADDLVREATDNRFDYTTRRLLVDTAPTSKVRVEVIEILDIYAYSVADPDSEIVGYTPLMLNIRGVLNREIPRNLPRTERDQIVREISNPQYYEGIREFLYLVGDKKGWNWGVSGRTNAVFLEPQVCDYFRQHF